MTQDVRDLEISEDGVLVNLPDLEKLRTDGSVEPLSLDKEYKPYSMASIKGLYFKRDPVKVAKEEEDVLNMVLLYFKETAENPRQFRNEEPLIRALWKNRLHGRIAKLNGLRSFMMDIGAESRGFLTFLADVPTALAMVIGYGLMRTLGGRLVPIPMSDEILRFSVWDRMFRFARFRCKTAQEYLDHAANPLFLGAGLLPELWMNKRKPRLEGQTIVAYDMDSGIEPYLKQLLGDDINIIDSDVPTAKKDGGWLDYHVANIERAFNDDDERGKHDYVFAMGVGSYYSKKLKWLFNGVRNLLEDGGYFIVDFQTMVDELVFDAAVLGWKSDPPLKPYKNLNQAVKKVSKAAKACGFEVVQYDTDMKPLLSFHVSNIRFEVAQYDTDMKTKRKSAGVVFVLRKI